MRSLFSLGLIFSVFFSGCQSASQQTKTISQELNINIGEEPQTLDPRKARDLSSLTVVRMLFEGLTRINKEELPELALAEKVDVSEDLLTYTFTLRNAFWSNGEPVTAHDFAYAWRKVLSPDFPADNAFQLYPIKNAKEAKEGKISPEQVAIRVLGDHQLQIELDNPTPYLLELIAHPVFFPVPRQLDETFPKWAENAATFVCNGPFHLDEWQHHYQLTVAKNEQYWDGKNVKIDKINLPMVNEDTAFKMFEKKELDWAGSPLSTLPLDALKILKSKNQAKIHPFLGTYFIRTQTQKPPFNNAKVRKAFALAIERSALVEHVTQGNQIPATGLVPLAMGLQDQPYFSDGDRETAKNLFAEGLQELGLTTVPEISLLYSANERSHLIAQALQQNWFEAFGIRVQLEAVERKVYFDRLSKQDYTLASCSWIADYNDPANFLEVFKYAATGANNTHWENTQYIQLLDEAKKTGNPLQRKAILQKSEQVLIEEMPILPVFYYTMVYMNNDQIKDVVLTTTGNIDFKWAHMETLKKE